MVHHLLALPARCSSKQSKQYVKVFEKTGLLKVPSFSNGDNTLLEMSGRIWLKIRIRLEKQV